MILDSLNSSDVHAGLACMVDLKATHETHIGARLAAVCGEAAVEVPTEKNCNGSAEKHRLTAVSPKG
jgi:hypothetical protein